MQLEALGNVLLTEYSILSLSARQVTTETMSRVTMDIGAVR